MLSVAPHPAGEAPTDVFSVEIYGSWDNFQRSYQLTRDKRSGAGQWRGCHRFENIICDGDLSDTSLKREGALKMGGTYWYYYRLNGDVDYHDAAEPSTSLCPSLPGQTVNVLEVPVQANGSEPSTPNGSTTSLDSSWVFTLDPKDKYVPLGVRRAATTSAIQQRKLRSPGQGGGDDSRHRPKRSDDAVHDQPPQTATSNEDEGPMVRNKRSAQSVFHRLRQTKSAGSGPRKGSPPRTGTSWSRKLLSRTGRSRKAPVAAGEIPEVPGLPDHLLGMAAPPSALAHGFSSIIHGSPAPPPPLCHKQTRPTWTPLAAKRDHLEQRATSSSTSSSGVWVTDSFAPPHPAQKFYRQSGDRTMMIGSAAESPRPSDPGPAKTRGGHAGSADRIAIHVPHPMSADDAHEAVDPSLEPSSLSYATSDTFPPSLASNTTASGNMSPVHLSQPDTPQMGGFADDTIAWRHQSDPDTRSAHAADSDVPDDGNPSRAPRSSRSPPAVSGHRPVKAWSGLEGFQGYRLPIHDRGSAATIKEPPSLDFDRVDRGFSHRESRQRLVQSWDDGSGQRLNALPDLVDDLGYLGTLIS
ncbi:MAG: hypothetical protein Q9163_003296 [Psora crenata]